MKRTTVKERHYPFGPPGRKQPGLSVDIALYKRFKVQAAREDRPTYRLLDDAMRDYLAKHERRDQ